MFDVRVFLMRVHIYNRLMESLNEMILNDEEGDDLEDVGVKE